jgi:two-component system nitrate/nitrite response regulator NarL
MTEKAAFKRRAEDQIAPRKQPNLTNGDAASTHNHPAGTKLEIIMLGQSEKSTRHAQGRAVINAPELDTSGVLIVGDDMLFREGLKRLLQTAPFTVEAESERLADLEALKAAGGKPDIVVVIDAPADPKAGWVSEVRNLWNDCRIVTLSNGTDEAMLTAALRAGADGCLFKDMSPAALVQAINLVALGENVAPLRMARNLAEGGRGRTATVGEARLTPREKDILYGLLAGHSNKVIANNLGTTDMTVKAQLRHLLRKIGATNRTQAALWARENGIDRTDEQKVALRQAH